MLRVLLIAIVILLSPPSLAATGEVAVNYMALKELISVNNPQLLARLSAPHQAEPEYVFFPEKWLNEEDTSDVCLFNANESVAIFGLFCEAKKDSTCSQYVVDRLPTIWGETLKDFLALYQPLLRDAIQDAQFLGHDDLKRLHRLLWLNSDLRAKLEKLNERSDPRRSLVEWLLDGDRQTHHLLILGLTSQTSATILVFPCAALQPPRHMQIDLQRTESLEMRSVLALLLEADDINFSLGLAVHAREESLEHTQILQRLDVFFTSSHTGTIRAPLTEVDQDEEGHVIVKGVVDKGVLELEKGEVMVAGNVEGYQLIDPNTLKLSDLVALPLDWRETRPIFNLIRASHGSKSLLDSTFNCTDFPFETDGDVEARKLIEQIAADKPMLSKLTRRQRAKLGLTRDRSHDQGLKDISSRVDALLLLWQAAVGMIGDGNVSTVVEIRQPLPKRSWLGHQRRSNTEAAAIFIAELFEKGGQATEIIRVDGVDQDSLELRLRLD